MNPIQVGVGCQHCGWPHYYTNNQISITDNMIRYTCKTTGLIGWEPNEPSVIEWLQANGVPSANTKFTVPPSAEVDDCGPGPSRRGVRGINHPVLMAFDRADTGARHQRSAWSWAPVLVTAGYVIAVAFGLVPRVTVMALALPLAVWVAWAVTRRWVIQ